VVDKGKPVIFFKIGNLTHKIRFHKKNSSVRNHLVKKLVFYRTYSQSHLNGGFSAVSAVDTVMVE
jgi:hypothetical protein